MKKQYQNYLNLTQVIQTVRKVTNQQQARDSRFDPSTDLIYMHVPHNADRSSALFILSDSNDNRIIGNILNATGLIDEAQECYRRSMWFEHVFDNKTILFCPKDKTRKSDCFSDEVKFINLFDSNCVEADACYYRCFVPRNTPCLIKFLGNENYFIEELKTLVFNANNNEKQLYY